MVAPAKIGPVITVRIPPHLLTHLDTEAARTGHTRADLIRRVLGEWSETTNDDQEVGP